MKVTLLALLLVACTIASQAKQVHKSQLRELLKDLLHKKGETKVHGKKQFSPSGSWGPPSLSGSWGPPPSGSSGPPPSGSWGPPGPTGFFCNNTAERIPSRWVCDGYKDCTDCSDEIMCEVITSDGGSYPDMCLAMSFTQLGPFDCGRWGCSVGDGSWGSSDFGSYDYSSEDSYGSYDYSSEDGYGDYGSYYYGSMFKKSKLAKKDYNMGSYYDGSDNSDYYGSDNSDYVGSDYTVYGSDYYGSEGFFCDNSDDTLMPSNWACDGYKDCTDCSDEVMCDVKTSLLTMCLTMPITQLGPFDCDRWGCSSGDGSWGSSDFGSYDYSSADSYGSYDYSSVDSYGSYDYSSEDSYGSYDYSSEDGSGGSGYFKRELARALAKKWGMTPKKTRMQRFGK